MCPSADSTAYSYTLARFRLKVLQASLVARRGNLRPDLPFAAVLTSPCRVHTFRQTENAVKVPKTKLRSPWNSVRGRQSRALLKSIFLGYFDHSLKARTPTPQTTSTQRYHDESKAAHSSSHTLKKETIIQQNTRPAFLADISWVPGTGRCPLSERS